MKTKMKKKKKRKDVWFNVVGWLVVVGSLAEKNTGCPKITLCIVEEKKSILFLVCVFVFFLGKKIECNMA